MMGLQWRILGPPVLISLCLGTLCAFTAVSLFYQQAATTNALRENVASRRAATELEECVSDLLVLLRDRVEAVSALHDRAQAHLRTIVELADQFDEQRLASRAQEGFTHYFQHWKEMPPPGRSGHDLAVKEAMRLLETDVLTVCQELRQYNTRRIEESTQQHDRVLRNLAWGMAGVSGLGAVAGLVLGFGVSQSLTQSIRRLRVQLRNAAGKLGPDFPELVLTEVGDFRDVHEEIDRLTGRIENVVLELEQREYEILRAEQLAAVGQLAAGVAHEIRNPLTSIKMLVQAGLEEGDHSGLTGEDLRIIEQQVRRMERLLQTFLDFTRPPRLERRTLDIVKVVRTVMGLIRGRADKQRVHVHLEAPLESVRLIADGEQLEQVLVNLALNALDAMPLGGTLFLTVRRQYAMVILEVADTGAGIAPDLMARLFRPFVSAKETGLGLGLVISRRIVEAHGGTITAANRPEGGALFIVSLPIGPLG